MSSLSISLVLGGNDAVSHTTTQNQNPSLDTASRLQVHPKSLILRAFICYALRATTQNIVLSAVRANAYQARSLNPAFEPPMWLMLIN